jgi:hypothetical protein
MTHRYNPGRAAALVNKSDSYGPETDEMTEALRSAIQYINHLEVVVSKTLPLAEGYYYELETRHYFDTSVREALANERTRLMESIFGRLVSIETEFTTMEELGLTELDLYTEGCSCGSTALPSQCCAKVDA